MNEEVINVLLIEDNPEDVHLIKITLKKIKTPVFALTAANTLEAGIARANEGRYALIFFDINLPDVDGIEAFKKLYRDVNSIPIIVLTSAQNETIGIKLLEEGAQDYLVKGEINRSMLRRVMLYSIERNRLFRELRAKTDELAENEQKYRDIVTNARTAIVKLDLDGNILFFNEFAERLFGYRENEILGKNIIGTLVTMDDIMEKSGIEVSPETVISIEKQPYGENLNTRKDGSKIWVSWTNKPILNDAGEMSGVLAVGTDVREHKRTEEALYDLNEKLVSTISSMDDMLFVLDKEGRFVDLYQPKRLSMLYLPSEVFIGKNYKDADLPPELIKRLAVAIDDLVETERGQQFDYSFEQEGSVRWFSAKVSMRTTRTGMFAGVTVVSRDITERKKMEERLRQSEERYRTVVEDQTELICRFRPDGVFTFVNDMYCRFFMKAPEDLIGNRFTPLIPEEDRRAADAEVAKLGVDVPYVTFEHRVYLPTGAYRWLQWTDRVLFNDEGEVFEYQSVGRDITERKHTERALRHRELILEAISFSAEQFLRTPFEQVGFYEILKELGEAMEASRVYIFENFVHEGERYTGLRYEWVAEYVTPLIERRYMKEIAFSTEGFSAWADALVKGEFIYGLADDFEPMIAKALRDHDIHSLIIAPIYAGEELWGFVGFDDCFNDRLWAPAEVEALKAVAGILGAYMRRKQAEEDLRLFKAMIESSREAIAITDRAGNLSYANSAHDELFCIPLAKAQQAPPGNFYPPETIEVLRNEVYPALERGEGWEGEIDVIDARGRRFPIWERADAILDQKGNLICSFGFMHDISENRRMREGLRRYEFLVNTSKDIMLLVDRDLACEAANAACFEAFNKEQDDVIGKNVRNLFEQENILAWIEESLTKCHEGESVEGEEWLNFPSGASLYMKVSFYPFYSEKESEFVTHAVVVFRDFTANKLMEEEKIAQEKKRREEELRQADKMIALGTLVAGVAHEINNPNSLIMMNASLLQRSWQSLMPVVDEYYLDNPDFEVGGMTYEEFKGEIQESYDDILEGSRRIKRIVDDLKNFARKEQNEEKRPEDMNALISSALTLMNAELKKSTSNLKVDLAEDLPFVVSNFQRIEQVIVNLVQNACHALPNTEKGIIIETRYDAPAKDVVITVTDEGEGINEEALKHIFDPFFTTKRDKGGTGLGLSVSIGIVNDHEGDLSFSSEEGKGTTATLRLPAYDEDA